MNSIADESASQSSFSREAAIPRILELERLINELETQAEKGRRRRSKLARVGIKTGLYAILGRGLTLSLGELLEAVRQNKRPYLGKELAKTIDLASRKLIGYKRWLLALGLLAATPGIVSMILLWQQNLTVAKVKDDTVSSLENGERVILLATIYDTWDKSELGMLTNPKSSPINRRDAVFRLIERDAEELAEVEEQDLLNLNRMVDISIAPLNEVDFSPLPGKPAYRFHNIGFVNSNFENASFEGCSFERVWFSAAYLWNTNFRNTRFLNTSFDEASIRGADFTGAVFENCDFSNAQFDDATLWPEGFDPEEAGAVRFAN